MTAVDVHHLAAAYALDALDRHEREAFETHYGACDVCRADVVEFRSTMAQVASAFAMPPGQAVKNRVMAEIATTRQVSPTVAAVTELAGRRSRSAWTVLAAAAAVVLAVVGVVSLTGDEPASYADELARVMEMPDAEMMYLGAGEGVDGSFKVAWSSSMGEAVLIGEDLPPAPAGKAYELWWFPQPGSTTAPDSPNADGRMAMYVLDTAADGNVHQVIDIPDVPAAWAITLEPVAGAAVTTGDVIFIAET